MAPPHEFTEDDLGSVVTWSAVRAARRLERILTEVLAAWNLSPVQFGVLVHLAVRPSMTQAALAREVHVRPQSMDPLLAGLEARGLVARSADRGRGRRNPVTLADAGLALLREVWGPVTATNDLSGFGVDADAGRDLNRALLRVATANHAAPADPAAPHG
ncbi:MarR family winged helix-turn-helix transcriptional regulator [Clavibacter nebraskensis]|uniref:MarR family winged helix-turn-helix transcriptional regulator n=1 Tax=Clavibacter nebraskensis TaxID=31963 RepID=UPI003F84E702